MMLKIKAVSAGIRTLDPWVMGQALYYWSIWFADDWASNKNISSTNISVTIINQYAQVPKQMEWLTDILTYLWNISGFLHNSMTVKDSRLAVVSWPIHKEEKVQLTRNICSFILGNALPLWRFWVTCQIVCESCSWGFKMSKIQQAVNSLLK